MLMGSEDMDTLPDSSTEVCPQSFQKRLRIKETTLSECVTTRVPTAKRWSSGESLEQLNQHSVRLHTLHRSEYRSYALGSMTKNENNEEESAKKKQCTGLVPHASSSIPNFYIIGHPSGSMIPLCAWYYPVAQTVLGGWLTEALTRSLGQQTVGPFKDHLTKWGSEIY